MKSFSAVNDHFYVLVCGNKYTGETRVTENRAEVNYVKKDEGKNNKII